MDIEITMRARAFSGEPVREHRVLVDSEDMTVRVWDSVAQSFTTCHVLGKDAIRRAIREALQWNEADACIERRGEPCGM